MSTAPIGTKPSFFQKTPRRAWLCLLLAVLLLVGGIVLYTRDDGGSAQLNDQISALSAAQTELDKQEARYQKRVTQLTEAKSNLEADPENEALVSKLKRAQGEYDKALKNRDNQLAKVQAMPTMDELSAQLTELKESTAGRLLTANLLLVGMLLAGAAAVALTVRRIDRRVLAAMAGLLLAGCTLACGMHRNNLSPVLQAARRPARRSSRRV